MQSFTTRCFAYVLAIAFIVRSVAVDAVGDGQPITIKVLNKNYDISLQCLENKKSLKNNEGKTSCGKNSTLGKDAPSECRFNVMADGGNEHQCPNHEYIVIVHHHMLAKQRMYRRILDGEHVDVEYRGSGWAYDKTTAIIIHPRNGEWEARKNVEWRLHYGVYLTCVATGEKLTDRYKDICVYCSTEKGCVFPMVRPNKKGNSLVYTKCPNQEYRIDAYKPLCRSDVRSDYSFNESIFIAVYEGQKLLHEIVESITIPDGRGDIDVEVKCRGYVEKQKPATNYDSDDDLLDYAVAIV